MFLSVLLSVTLPRSVFLKHGAAAGSADHAPRVERIVNEHVDAVWRTARRLGIPTRDLDDVVQEVMLVVFRRIADIELTRERAFVLGATARVSANWRRSRRRHPEEPTDALDELLGASATMRRGAPADAELMLERNEKLMLLDGALHEMNEEQRSAFVMFELEQMTASEIARELGVRESTIVSRVRRAREAFRSFCERKDKALEPRSGPA